MSTKNASQTNSVPEKQPSETISLWMEHYGEVDPRVHPPTALADTRRWRKGKKNDKQKK